MKKFIYCWIYLAAIKSSFSLNRAIVQTDKHTLYQENFNKITPVEFQQLYTFLNSFSLYGSRINMLVESLLSLKLAEKLGISCVNKSPFEIHSSLLDHQSKQINISLAQVQDSFKRYKIQYFGISAPLKDKKWVQSKIKIALKDAAAHGIESAIKKYSKLKCNSHQFVFHDLYNFSKDAIDAQGKEFQTIYKLPINKLSPVFSITRNQRTVSGFCKIIQISNKVPHDFNQRRDYYILNHKKKEADKMLSQKLKSLAPHSLKWRNENFKVLYQLYNLHNSLGSTPDLYKSHLYEILHSAIKAYKTDSEGKRFGLLTAYNAAHNLQNITNITEKEKSSLNHQLIGITKEIIASEKNHFKRDVKIHLELINCLSKIMDPMAGKYLVQAAENINPKDLSAFDFVIDESKRLQTKRLISPEDRQKISQIILHKRSL